MPTDNRTRLIDSFFKALAVRLTDRKARTQPIIKNLPVHTSDIGRQSSIASELTASDAWGRERKKEINAKTTAAELVSKSVDRESFERDFLDSEFTMSFMLPFGTKVESSFGVLLTENAHSGLCPIRHDLRKWEKGRAACVTKRLMPN